MDIKQGLSAVAAVTLGKDMTFRDYAQGAFRMRGIGKGQKVQVGRLLASHLLGVGVVVIVGRDASNCSSNLASSISVSPYFCYCCDCLVPSLLLCWVEAWKCWQYTMTALRLPCLMPDMFYVGRSSSSRKCSG